MGYFDLNSDEFEHWSNQRDKSEPGRKDQEAQWIVIKFIHKIYIFYHLFFLDPIFSLYFIGWEYPHLNEWIGLRFCHENSYIFYLSYNLFQDYEQAFKKLSIMYLWQSLSNDLHQRKLQKTCFHLRARADQQKWVRTLPWKVLEDDVELTWKHYLLEPKH